MTTALLQILSNLANDCGDTIKGSDTKTRIGTNRSMQKEIISLACKKLEGILGFLALRLMAIVTSITYTVGRKLYRYIGLGDISVLIFFG